VPIEAKRRQDYALHPEQVFSSALSESSVIATLSISLQGKLLSANQRMLNVLGVGSIAELASTDFKTDIVSRTSDWEHWESAIASGRADNVEIKLRRNGGQAACLRGDIRLVSDPTHDTRQLYGFFADVTTPKQIRSALERTAQMEAVGSLTSGIAHDFNNLLTVLVGNLYLVAEGVRANPSLFDKVKRARDAAKRGADLTRQLVSFARAERLNSGALDTSRLIGDLQPLLERAVGSKIELQMALDPAVAPIDGNAAQLESVIVNLTINARDAIDGAGTIVIKASNACLEAAESTRRGLEPGEYVSISVTDDGSGIADALRDRVFEPFFSTKSDGAGTGLGLSMVRWLTEQAGGDVDLTSRPGLGTTVSLLLPRSARSTADTGIKTMPLSTLPTGDERVLVLAGDEEIRSMIQQILRVLGYTVRLSHEPEESLKILENEAIKLVMIDSTGTAEIGVVRLVETIRKLNPSIKTIIINDASSPEGESGSSQLIKPFSLLELSTAVRQTLDGDANE